MKIFQLVEYIFPKNNYCITCVFILFYYLKILPLKGMFGHEKQILSKTTELADMDMSNHVTACIPLKYNPTTTAAA